MATALNRNSLLAVSAALILAAAGCDSHDELLHGEDFYANGAPTASGRLAESQAAAGAKRDGMLYPRHFDGDTLNALGQTKMDLMLKGTSVGNPMTVYLVMPADLPKVDADARQAAVAAYLRDAGISATQVAFASGPNPTDSSPVAFYLPVIYSAEGPSYSGASADLQPAAQLGTLNGK